ncbi:MAG: ThaI family type II restriction endonuclease [bacterium]|jgi:hypothetical protein
MDKLFTDIAVAKRIQQRLPELFQLAELESSRAGKVGMEVGSVREKIIIALLMFVFGETNVVADLPITEPELDVLVNDIPLSIKTITGKKLSGVKLVWTVDATKALEFLRGYKPKCNILLVQINWGGQGGLYYFPLRAQTVVINSIGTEKYIKLPKSGTNPRGVELTQVALEYLAAHPLSKKLEIKWEKEAVSYNPYTRWLELWRAD